MERGIQADKAYAFIREQLLSGNFKPGERLAEQALCESAGVNRGDVRQAFSRFLVEGLVVRGERGGIFVRRYTEQDLMETFEVRQILETAAVRLAVERATEQDLQELEETARHMLMMAENGYILGVGEGDLRFHNLLVKAAHNNKLYNLYIRANIPLSSVNFIKKEKEKDIGHKGLIQDSLDHVKMAESLRQKNVNSVLELISKNNFNG